MALLCRRKTLLYRELHGLGLRESYYSNGKFNRVISSFDQFRVSRMGISKAVQMQPAVKKPSHEEMTKERLPEPRPFDLYRSICSSDRRGGAVAALKGWLNGGRKAAKWEPNHVISDPMKYKRDIHALQKRNFASESDKADENQQEANTETLDEDYYNKLPEPTDEENDMLDLAFGLTETSRLGCQVIAKPELDGMKVALPAATRNFAVDGYVPKPH